MLYKTRHKPNPRRPNLQKPTNLTGLTHIIGYQPIQTVTLESQPP